MANLVSYNRESAAKYAMKWALSRNSAYRDYEEWGGDCTNFISQCVHAGGIPFDHNGNNILKQWYWYSDISRTPSWTGAEPFYKYIIGNNSKDTQNFGIGDIVQLVYEDNLAYHNMIISDIILDGDFLVDYLICQHTYDLLNYPLSLKAGDRRYIKIFGYYE